MQSSRPLVVLVCGTPLSGMIQVDTGDGERPPYDAILEFATSMDS